MFDIGFTELLLLSLVGLLVLGPERLPRVARTLGGLARRARSSWLSLRRSIEAEMRAEELREPLQRFRDEGPDEAELTAAKQNITGGFPLRIASNSNIVEYLAMIGFYGLPLDYLDRFTERVNSVTRAQIQDAFQRRLDLQRLVTVVVGNGEAPQPEG